MVSLATMAEHVKGDLFETGADVLVQQCNCVSRKTHGLSAIFADRLGADPYGGRPRQTDNLATPEGSDTPGTALLCNVGNGTYVACLFGQYAPGRPGQYEFYKNVCKVRGVEDTKKNRLMWFREALDELGSVLDGVRPAKVAFPYKIGCGMAGGRWEDYSRAIDEWAAAHLELRVLIVELSQEK